jgi:hypothetical protein
MNMTAVSIGYLVHRIMQDDDGVYKWRCGLVVGSVRDRGVYWFVKWSNGVVTGSYTSDYIKKYLNQEVPMT